MINKITKKLPQINNNNYKKIIKTTNHKLHPRNNNIKNKNQHKINNTNKVNYNILKKKYDLKILYYFKFLLLKKLGNTNNG